MDFKRLPEVPLDRILEHLAFHERFSMRRVSKDVKNAVEGSLRRTEIDTFNPFADVLLMLDANDERIVGESSSDDDEDGPMTKVEADVNDYGEYDHYMDIRAEILQRVLSLIGPKIRELSIRRLVDAIPIWIPGKKLFYALESRAWPLFGMCTGVTRLDIDLDTVELIDFEGFADVFSSMRQLESLSVHGFGKPCFWNALRRAKLGLKDISLPKPALDQYAVRPIDTVISMVLPAGLSPSSRELFPEFGPRLLNLEVYLSYDVGETHDVMAADLSTILNNSPQLLHLKIVFPALYFSDERKGDASSSDGDSDHEPVVAGPGLANNKLAGVQGLAALTRVLTEGIPKLRNLMTLQLLHNYASMSGNCDHAPSNRAFVAIPGDAAMLGAIAQLPNLVALALGNFEKDALTPAALVASCSENDFPKLTRLGLIGWTAANEIGAVLEWLGPVGERLVTLSLQDSDLGPGRLSDLLDRFTKLRRLSLEGTKYVGRMDPKDTRPKHTSEGCNHPACTPTRTNIPPLIIQEYLINRSKQGFSAACILFLSSPEQQSVIVSSPLLTAYNIHAFPAPIHRELTSGFATCVEEEPLVAIVVAYP